MSDHKPIRAVYTGTFDPITNGHLDIIRRASELFDELIIAVGHNPEKQSIFTPVERLEMIRELIAGMDGVTAESYQGLTADFVRSRQAKVIIRGIRDNVDLHFELQQANVNMVVGEVETVFLMARDQFAMISSTYIKQIVELGMNDLERLGRLVPPQVAERLNRRFGR